MTSKSQLKRLAAQKAPTMKLEDTLRRIATMDPNAPWVTSWKAFARTLQALAKQALAMPYDPEDHPDFEAECGCTHSHECEAHRA